MNSNDEVGLSGQALAVRSERIDADSGFDQWSAAPGPVVQALQLAAARHGELRMVRSAVPFSHFNMVLTLGCPAPADEAAFAAIEHFHGAQAGRSALDRAQRPHRAG